MSDEEYKAYVERAEVTNFTGRTLDGIHGLQTRKPISITIPESLKQYLDNVDGKGNTLNRFINDSTYDHKITGWGGVLIDSPNGKDENGNSISIAEAEEKGIYPYLTFYQAEKIINVKTRVVGRKTTVILIVLHEQEEVESTDSFTTDLKDRYRVLDYDENGYYRETVYDEYGVIINSVNPEKFGQKMKHIPFYFLNSIEPSKPLLKDLVDVNQSWFHKSADLENGAHWTGVPTPYCVGYEPETVVDASGNMVAKNTLKLGGSQFIYFPMGVSQVGYLEFSGAGLSQLIKMMSDDEERMAILGAHIISQEKKGVESAETAKIHRAGENSVIASLSVEYSEIFTAIIREYLEWTIGREISEEIKIELPVDFDVVNMSAGELTALVSLWQTKGISKKVLFNNLKDGEIVPNDMTFEEMEEDIANEKETTNTDIGGDEE